LTASLRYRRSETRDIPSLRILTMLGPERRARDPGPNTLKGSPQTSESPGEDAPYGCQTPGPSGRSFSKPHGYTNLRLADVPQELPGRTPASPLQTGRSRTRGLAVEEQTWETLTKDGVVMIECGSPPTPRGRSAAAGTAEAGRGRPPTRHPSAPRDRLPTAERPTPSSTDGLSSTYPPHDGEGNSTLIILLQPAKSN
jgi:hypothetical protein